MFEWLTDWFRKDSSTPPATSEETFDAIARLPELRESHTGADLSLKIDDQRWVRLGAQLAGDIDAATRTRLVQLHGSITTATRWPNRS